MTVSAEFRGTECYVAWGAAGRGRLFFLSAPEAKQDVEYLLLFLENYAALVESVRGAVEEMGLPMDDASEESPRAWCRGLMAALRQQMEAGHRLGVIGMVE